jgi:hypothetical protein
MESPLDMLFHGSVLGLVCFLLMKYMLKQPNTVSQSRSILIGALATIYMILFGHGLPTKINKI